MADNVRASGAPAVELDGSGVRLAIVCGRFNDHVTMRLLEGARRGAAELGVPSESVTEEWVPGAFEIPFAAKAIAESGRVDAVVCLGAVIRGETSHYDFVAGECARGIQDVQLAVGLPVVFGVLTTEDLAQAEARSAGPGEHNVGEECAQTAVEMVALQGRWA
ncbi:MAG: 6,7-dimethyl-8-ribityllumazine synthase [Actinomycetia bacterium]|nr:6,7-dimethyl-8-ribityllumazine synthase [Actinomycetes bacterium]